MGYKEDVVKIANSDKTSFERGDIIIKEMNRLATNILDYRYAAEHYEGNGNVLEDTKNNVVNSLAILISDLDVYTEQLGVEDKIKYKTYKRIEKIAKKVDNS